jgi:hypothetical protein
MGNLTQKEYSTDICLDQFVKYLCERKGYKLKSFETSEKEFMEMLKVNINNTVIKFGDIYCFKLSIPKTKEEYLKAKAQTCLIYPFLVQICGDFHEEWLGGLLDDYSGNDKNKQIDIYVMGFSQLNWCKIISSMIVEIEHDKVSNAMIPVIQMLCAVSANTHEAEQELFKLHKLDDFCNDSYTSEDEKCLQLKEIALKKTKVGLGTIMMYFVMLSLYKLYPYIKLECEKDLIYYYQKFGFKLGQRPGNSYKWDFQKNGKFKPFHRFKSLSEEKLQTIISEINPTANKVETIKLEEQYSVFSDRSNIDDSYVYMFFDFEYFQPRDFIDKMLRVKNNLKYLSEYSTLFDLSNEYTRISYLLNRMTCLDNLIDSKLSKTKIQ